MTTALDPESLTLLEDTLRKTMLATSGPALDAALTELGWAEMLTDVPELAVPLVFRLLGETGSHASVLVDVVLHATGNPLRREDEGYPIRVAEARVAVGWWLVGSARAMLSLARRHALDRVQFGKPIASFQAVRHRLAETLVAIEGAEATLTLPGADNPDLTALLAKAAAGKAALTAAKHCQQVLGGIGFTEEHDLHRHVKRALVLEPGARRPGWRSCSFSIAERSGKRLSR